MMANKEYALAGKFFEYIFEPALASRNSFFYEIEFHKFIATFLHVSAQAGDPDAIEVLEGFSGLMRSQDPQQLETILAVLDRLDQSSPLAKIVTFALCNRKSIEDELANCCTVGTNGNLAIGVVDDCIKLASRLVGRAVRRAGRLLR